LSKVEQVAERTEMKIDTTNAEAIRTLMFTDLTIAVIQQLGYDPQSPPDELFSTMTDIMNHGAAGGFHGFIYYHDTVRFYDANEDAIWGALCDDAEDWGVTPMQMIAGFTIADQITDVLSFKEALAWYALERAASEAELAMINMRHRP